MFLGDSGRAVRFLKDMWQPAIMMSGMNGGPGSAFGLSPFQGELAVAALSSTFAHIAVPS